MNTDKSMFQVCYVNISNQTLKPVLSLFEQKNVDIATF